MSDEQSVSVFEAFEGIAGMRSKVPAVIYLGTKYTYGWLKSAAEKFSEALYGKGVREGDRVILYLPHGIQWVVVWLGIQRLGGVCVPITPIFTSYDLKHIVEDSGAETIVCADTNFGYVSKILPESGIKRVVVTGMADLLPWWKQVFGRALSIVPKGDIAVDDKTYLFRNMLGSGRTRLPAGSASQEQDLIEILYTGGTTKSPKGVPINGKLFLTQCRNAMESIRPIRAPEENVFMCGVPLFHILGQTLGLGLILSGGTLILHPRPNLDAIFACIQRFRAKTMIGVPALYRMILDHRRLEQYDLGSVECWMSAGDVMPVEVEKRFREKIGRPIFQAYGTTETGGGVCMTPVEDANPPPKSIGRCLPGKEIRIVDPVTLEPVEDGVAGELLVSSEFMITSYLNKPEETEKAFVNMQGLKWYRTGDIVSRDESGNLFFVDRTSDTIKHKGYRISSSEIEATLQEHPAVIGACVVGVPDRKVGERIKAFVVLREDVKGITGYDLIRWCRERLTPYKVPQYIEFRDMLPKSKVGKLLKRDLRDEELKRLAGC
ncbi:MAG: long-chain fatty acid--CoA ligase [Desulfobacteraceae bacterium]|nr:MAG: long-chain fatty acid--CoA ligase [Desulfobacteraceae bacterium]